MKDLMLDIETLATCHNAVMTQISSVYFDRYTGELGNEILINISIQDCFNCGLEVDQGALEFWYEHIPTFLECWAPSWRRACKVLLRNDYWCKGLGQVQPKSEAYERFKVMRWHKRHKEVINEKA